MELNEFALWVKNRVNSFMQSRLDAFDGYAPSLKEAMSYGLILGGKRSRPLLVYATGKALGASDAALDYAAAAVECIHAYSLIHDDMPEMDDDELRRGHPTVHKKFGQATALLAGDALQTLGFEFASDKKSGLSGELRGDLCAVLAKGAGFSGMCGGQAMDLDAEGKHIPLERLKVLHSKKTGALIKAAVQLGAVGAGASEEQIRALTIYAEKTGLAFQIWDDVLDVIGDEAVTGKPVGNDAAAGKSTYPALFGLDKAEELAAAAKDEALAALKEPALSGVDTDLLAQFAVFCVTRSH